ncbi:MAG: protein kinase [Myxococcales bacterium]|nr:protein kinase [Myxococcales bacterium]
MESQAPRIGQYEVVRPVGAGGMAAVYLCRKTGVGGFEHELVVKVLLEDFLDKAEFVDMFMDEARMMARMSHPHLVQVFDLGMAGPVPYMAMEYVRSRGWASGRGRPSRPIRCSSPGCSGARAWGSTTRTSCETATVGRCA